MPLSDVDIIQLEKFVNLFVSIFEETLLNYHKNLVEEVPKAGKWAELVDWVIRMSTTGVLLGATTTDSNATAVGASLALPLLSLTLSNVGIHYNRQKLTKLTALLEVFQKNEERRIKIKKNLVEAAIFIFRSFEIKFKDVTINHSNELALLKLARDAVDRAFNFFYKNSSLLESEKNFFSSINITKAIILGQSKRYKSIFFIPNRHVGYSLDNGITTTQLYQETPVLKVASQAGNYSYKINNARNISDFRLVFEWEEEREEVNTPIQWGVDDEIMLFENRPYKKTKLFMETILSSLTLVYLTEEKLQEIQERIFDGMNQSSSNLEQSLKRELEEVKTYIRKDVIEEIDKLEENVSDIRDLMIVTLESLTTLKEGQDKISKKIVCLTERKFNFRESIDVALETLKKPPTKQIAESVLGKLKYYLSRIDASNNQGFYIPLDGCYDTSIHNRDRFPLFNKVIFSLRNSTNKTTLFILGEAGSGKTSFSIHLTQCLLASPLFSMKRLRILPLYIRLSSISEMKALKTTTIEDILKSHYKFSSKEIEFLLTNQQHFFCFIFDGIESDLDHNDFHFLHDLYDKFPLSYCIFTACLSKFRSEKYYKDLLIPVDIYGKQKLKFLQEKTIRLAPFNEKSKKNYINQYLDKGMGLALNYENVDAVYRRIQAIPSLDDIVGLPIFLMMTMEILPYLERFYQQEKIMLSSENIQKDLFHMYTHFVYRQAAAKIKEKKGIVDVKGVTIYDCILTYSIKLARLMKETGLVEIKENQLFASKDLFSTDSTSEASSSVSNQSNTFSKLTFDQYSGYKRCFSKKYDSYFFEDGDEFRIYKYGYQGCDFLHSCEIQGNVSYSFVHNKFLHYFYTLPDNKVRRNKIQEFMDNNKPSTDAKAGTSLKASISSIPLLPTRRASTSSVPLLPTRRASISSVPLLPTRRASTSRTLLLSTKKVGYLSTDNSPADDAVTIGPLM